MSTIRDAGLMLCKVLDGKDVARGDPVDLFESACQRMKGYVDQDPPGEDKVERAVTEGELIRISRKNRRRRALGAGQGSRMRIRLHTDDFRRRSKES